MEQNISCSTPRTQSRFTAGSIILAAFLLSISTGLMTIIIPTDAAKQGVSYLAIGLKIDIILMMVIPLTLSLPAIVHAIGIRAVFIMAALLRGAAIVALSYSSSDYFGMAALMLYGAGEFTFIFLLKSWVGDLNFHKGKRLALVGIAVSLGIATSVAVIEWLFHYAINPYRAAAWIGASALIPVVLNFAWVPNLEKVTIPAIIQCFRTSPLIIASIPILGVQMVGIQYYIILYGLHAGLTTQISLIMLISFMLGMVIFPLTVVPLLFKRYDRRDLLMAGVLLSLVCAFYLPLAVWYPYITYGLLFFWGGIIGNSYIATVGLLQNRYEGKELVAAKSAFIIVFCASAMVAVALMGLLADPFGLTDALPGIANLANISFFYFAANRYVKSLSKKSQKDNNALPDGAAH